MKNLADAIRRAALDESHTQPARGGFHSIPRTEDVAIEPDYGTRVEVPMAAKTNRDTPETLPEAPQATVEHPHAHVAGNVVRLELFMTAEQMSGMLRAIMQGQHSVLTLKEAATYLRVNSATLVRMAQEGIVPGIEIDGRWRFSRARLDDWIAVNSAMEEEEHEADAV